MAWLAGWDKRIKLDIDYTNKIGASVTWFPITIHLKDANGDSTKVFEEVTTNSRKIAITKADGETELKGEIEQWDYDAGTPSNSVGIIHTSADGWTIDGDTSIYLYYDKDHADNANIGDDPHDTASNAVWDDYFLIVWHLFDYDSSTVWDSTSNSNDGNKTGANTPTEAAAIIGLGQDFDANEQIVSEANCGISGSDSRTYEIWINNDSWESEDTRMMFTGATSANDVSALMYQGGTSKLGHWGYFADVMESGTTETTGTDIYFAGTYDGTTYKLYKNEAADNSGEITLTTTATPLTLAQNNQVNGRLDEVRMSSTDRSAAWMKGTFYSGSDGLLTYGSEEEAPSEFTPTIMNII